FIQFVFSSAGMFDTRELIHNGKKPAQTNLYQPFLTVKNLLDKSDKINTQKIKKSDHHKIQN
ncbi:MAG: hypothetical protein ACK5AJ_11430, partial [bacterium]